MIKLVIFDLDGTLLDTLDDIHYVLNETLEKFGLPLLSRQQTMSYVGNGARKLVECAVGGRLDDVESVAEYYGKRFAECSNVRTRLFDGEESALERMKKQGIEFAIVTNKPQRATDNVYFKFLSRFGFGEVIGQSERYPLKPDPTSTLAIIDKYGFDKKECVFVGDGETDVATAKEAGIKCVSALWGYRTKRRLSEAGSDIFADNFTNLADIILNFTKFL